MSLTSIGDIIAEQGRIYRSAINGRIKPSDMCRYMFGLREIRCSLEALAAMPDGESTSTISIVEVPSGAFIRHVDELSLRGEALTIEHMPIEATSKTIDSTQTMSSENQIEPRTPAEARLLHELDDMTLEQLMQKARELVAQS